MTKSLAAREDRDELSPEEVGRRAIAYRRLEPLREYLGLTRNAMASLLHTSLPTYTSWEVNPDTRIWPSTAQRVGAFYRAARAEIQYHEDTYGKGALKGLVPFHVAATYCGLPHELLLSWYREGRFEAVELGVLGLWVSKQEIRVKLNRSIPLDA
jgi:hypothetical protein